MQKIKDLTTRNLLLLHLSLYAIGMLGVIYAVARGLNVIVFQPVRVFINYADWAEFSLTPSKPVELIHYGLSVLVLFAYFPLVGIIVRRFSTYCEEIRRVVFSDLVFFCYLACSLIINLFVWRVKHILYPLFVFAWLLGLLWPMWRFFDIGVTRTLEGGKAWQGWVLACMVTWVGWAFYPYLSGTLPVSNDYFDIPEQTILSTGVVDNTSFINRNEIGGLSKNDPRVFSTDAKGLKDGSFIQVQKTPELSSFIAMYSGKFLYDESAKALVITGAMRDKEFEMLANLLPQNERPLLYAFRAGEMRRATKSYTPIEIEFIKKNRRELMDQALAGHYFHHQHTMLGTINEYLLGKPREETIYLYGFLSTVSVAEMMTRVFGEVTFASYQQALYTFYPVYFLMLMAAAAIIFRRKDYVLLVTAIGFASIGMLKFEVIRFAPGFNPLRHLFDVVALACMYGYFLRPSRKQLYFLGSLGACILGILFNKEFGGALLLSLIATLLVKAVVDRQFPKFEFALTGISIVGLWILLQSIPTAKNPTLLYVLLGIAAPTMHWLKMLFLLSVVWITYLFLGKAKDSGNGWRYLALFYFFYAQGLMIYVVWNPEQNHWWSLGAVWGLLAALLLRFSVSNSDWMARNEEKLVQAGNLFVLIFLCVPAVVTYSLDKHDFDTVFDDHVVHQWELPRAQIKTTMEPEVFNNAVALIDRYASGNSIYILSKYDNFLPFLSGKYSAMPFQEVALSLVTQKEVEKSIDAILQGKPEYLFVDSDMAQVNRGVYRKDDAVTGYLALHDASMGRAMVLNNFAQVFKGVEALYEPVELGQLITVYKLRAKH